MRIFFAFSRATKAGLVVMVSLLVACSGEDPVAQSQQFLERAQAYQEQGQFKASMIEYRNAIKQSPDADLALVSYAKMLNQMGQHEGAQDVLKQVNQKANPAMQLAQAESFIGLGKYRSAESVLSSEPLASNAEYSSLVKFLSGKVAAGQTRLAESKSIYRGLIDSGAQPVVGKARVALAKVQASEKQFDEALNNIAQVSSDDESYIEAQVIRASIKIVKEELEQAEEILSTSLTLLPNTDVMLPEKAVVLERLSYVLTRLGRSNEAYIYQKLLADAFPGANELKEQYGQALEAFRAKDFVKAKTDLQGILDDHPGYQKAMQLLGIISYLEGNTTQASELLGDSVDPEVADPVTRHIYAATSLRLNEPKKVIEILEPDIHSSQDPETIVLYGLAAISDGNRQRGEEALKRAVALAPESANVRLVLADFYRQSGQSQKELGQLNAAYDSAPTQQDVLASLVSHHLRHEGQEAAKAFVMEALKANPEVFATNAIAGYFFSATSSFEQAGGYFSKALTLNRTDDQSVEVLLAKGRTELLTQQYSQGESSFLSALNFQPESELAYSGLLEIYRRNGESDPLAKLESFAKRNAVVQPYFVLVRDAVSQGELERAVGYVTQAQSLNVRPDQVQRLGQTVKYAQALQFVNKGRFSEARAVVADLLGSMSDNIRLLALLADLELKDGKTNEAVKVLNQIEVASPGHPIIPILKADIAVAQDDLTEAKDVLIASWKTQRNELVVDKLYNVLLALKDSKLSASYLDEWRQAYPDSPKPMLFKAMGYQQRGQRLKATELYEAVLVVTPNDVTSLNNLGWIYFEKNDSRSVELLRRAAELAPNNPAVLDSLGWVLFKTGEVEEGRTLLKQALELAPDSEEIQAHYQEAKG